MKQCNIYKTMGIYHKCSKIYIYHTTSVKKNVLFPNREVYQPRPRQSDQLY
uniref:Uncharacterized protein n=1 Tax=Xenopus tropicalis TaxID=8364 RepID=A0A1B8Y365_XENTR